MGTKVPVVGNTRWLMVLPPLAVLGALIALSGLAFGWVWWSMLIAFGVWLAYTFTARWVWVRHHRAGLRALQAGRWEEAIECYRRGEALFREKPWIDRWRPLTLMTASAMSFTEVAVNNIGVAQLQAEDALAAEATFERGLAEFPDSIVMQNALHSMRMGAAAMAAREAAQDGEPPAA